MYEVIKNLSIAFIRFSGLPQLNRILRQKNNITIICYHNIDKKGFQKQVKFLIKYYNLITISTLKAFFENNNTKLPSYPLLITFDDGHSGNYELLKTIQKFNIKPTIFLTANIVGTEKPFWFNIKNMTRETKQHFKKIPDIERRSYIKQHYTGQDKNARQSLSWKEVFEMNPYCDFQSHTLDHPCLINCDVDVVKYELTESKKIIEEKTNKKVFAIAYPNGDYGYREMEIAEESGYSLCFTMKPGLVNNETNPLAINRFSINDTSNYNEFILRTTGVWALFKGFFKKLKGITQK